MRHKGNKIKYGKEGKEVVISESSLKPKEKRVSMEAGIKRNYVQNLLEIKLTVSRRTE